VLKWYRCLFYLIKKTQITNAGIPTAITLICAFSIKLLSRKKSSNVFLPLMLSHLTKAPSILENTIPYIPKNFVKYSALFTCGK
jgi:hypothetical protein